MSVSGLVMFYSFNPPAKTLPKKTTRYNPLLDSNPQH